MLPGAGMAGSMKPERARTAAGWRRPVSDLLLFACFLLLGDRLIHLGLENWEARLGRYDSRLELFQGSGAPRAYDILVLGTSRTFEGVHPFYLVRGLKKSVFKEAYAGKGPRYHYYFYREFRKRFPPPRLVIYGIDYFVFGLRSDRLPLARLGLKPFREDQGLQPLRLLADKARFDTLLLRTLAVFENRFIGHRPAHDRDQAFMAAYVGSPPRGQVVESKPPRFFKVRFRKFPGKEGAFLRRLLEELRRDGVRVCLLILPDHIGTYRTNANQRMFRREIRRLSREFPGAFVCDLGDPDVFPTERADLFLNGGYGRSNSHLSRDGAALLNERLVRELRTRLPGP